MKIEKRALGHIGANCYMVSQGNTAVVVDPGVYKPEIAAFLAAADENCRFILLTHAHFDHIGGAARLRQETGAVILIGEGDAPALADEELNYSKLFHAHVAPFRADRLLTDGDELCLGAIKVTAISTPGHTPGGMCYLTEDVLFAGDTLFCGSVGRTDFCNSNPADMEASLCRLMLLKDSLRVLCGHGEETTIGHERATNPYLV